MSYRTRVNGVQIFGNNESYQKWIDFIKDEGIDVDEEGIYEGYITHVDKALDVLEEIVFDIHKNMLLFDTNIYDLSKSVQFWTAHGEQSQGIYDALCNIKDNSYMFIPYVFVEACGDNVETFVEYIDKKRFHHIRLKDDGQIFVNAS